MLGSSPMPPYGRDMDNPEEMENYEVRLNPSDELVSPAAFLVISSHHSLSRQQAARNLAFDFHTCILFPNLLPLLEVSISRRVVAGHVNQGVESYYYKTFSRIPW